MQTSTRGPSVNCDPPGISVLPARGCHSSSCHSLLDYHSPADRPPKGGLYKVHIEAAFRPPDSAGQSKCPRSESPIWTFDDGKYSFHRAVTVAAVFGSHDTSFGYHGFIRASITIGGS